MKKLLFRFSKLKTFIYLILTSLILNFSGCSKDVDAVASIDADSTTNGPVKVEVISDGENSRIYRNGEPYFIRGAAYNSFLDQVDKYGGNSIRTYSINEETQSVLDSAQHYGLTVCLGIWIKRERDGFDYDDQEKVDEQLEEVRADVLKYKDHPALLMWGIGNEADSKATNFKLYDAVGKISNMIHEVDPNHITTTVLAGTKTDHIKEIMERAPSLDVLSINTYASIINSHNKIKQVGWTKPYLFTEWGPRGTWENPPKTSWGGLIELTSTEKAKVYRDTHTNYIAANANKGCIGSYVFLWGFQNHGAVATWYGLFTRKKNPLGAADAMHYSWKGTFPSNRAPQIGHNDILLNRLTAEQSIRVKVGQTNNASIKALDFEGEDLKYEWHIVREGFVVDKNDQSNGVLPGITGFFETNDEKNVRFTINQTGEYRLYAFAIDKEGNAANAVIPFLVE
jgi:hypothetical protein